MEGGAAHASYLVRPLSDRRMLSGHRVETSRLFAVSVITDLNPTGHGRMHRSLTSVALLGAIGGCGREPHEPPPLARDSADIRILEWAEGRSSPEELHLVALPFAVRPPEFGDILDVAIVAGHGLAVLDPMGPHVVILDSTGAEALRFGGDGDGPGEFRAAGLTDLVALDGAIAVPDLARQRVTLFDVDGRVRLSLPVPVDDGLTVDWRGIGGDGLLLRRASDPQRLEVIFPPGSRSEVVADLSFLSLPSEPGPLRPLPVWCSLGDHRLVVGRTDAYALRILDGGRTTALLRRSLAERPVGESDMAHLEELLRASLSRRAGGRLEPGMVRGLLERTPLPDRGPLIARLICSPRGEVWVQHALPVAEMGVDVLRVGSSAAWGGGTWDVFDVNAGTLQRVELPRGTQLTRVDRGLIIGYETDTYGRKSPARWVRAPQP